MAYSYTERKRIRKSFGSRDSVLEVPYLLQMQKDAYTAFLQADVPPLKSALSRAAGRFRRGLPHRLAQRFCRDEVSRVQPGQARLRCARMPDPWPDLRVGRARQGPADHL
jgi:DNA-directed RNA polymerase beta subunit